METPRKVQLTGRNTYIVSLPHEWISNRGVKKGDPLYLVQNSDGTITLSLKQENKELKTCTISTVNQEKDTVMRNIVSAYVGGAGKIVLRGSGISTVAEEARRVLSGVEITDENGDELILRILSYDELDIDGIIKREYNVTNGMFGIVISKYYEGTDIGVEIARKEDDVDRLYLLLLRNVALGMGREREVVFKTMVAKSIEKISDHLEDICNTSNGVEKNEDVANLIKLIHIMYSASYETYVNNDVDNKTYQQTRKKYTQMAKELDEKIKKDKNQGKMLSLKTLVEKCDKLVRYTEDIMESSCDLAFAKTDQPALGSGESV